MSGVPGTSRYGVRASVVNGRPYLSDGTNWVAWVDGMSGEEITALADATERQREAWQAKYVAARADGMANNPAGWAHADCSHADGICQGGAR